MQNITLRLASVDDLQLLYEWTNDKSVREQSFSTAEISLNEHSVWFKNKLADHNSIMYIIEIDRKSAGIIRFEMKDESTIISISIDSHFRGKGLSSKMLIRTCKEYFLNNSKPVLAYIKKTNIASIKSFKNAGFIYLRDEKIRGAESELYQLKNEKKYE